MHFKKRNLIAVLALTIVTFGIYYLFWLYFTRKEIVASSGNPKAIPSYWVLFAPFLIGLLLLIIPLIILGAAGENSDTFANGMSAFFGIVGVLLILSGCGVIFWWNYLYCKALSAVTKGMDLTTSYVLFIVTNLFGVGIIWQLLAQNDMNHAADGRSTNGHSTGHSVEPAYPQYPSEPTAPSAPAAPAAAQHTPSAPHAPVAPVHHQPFAQEDTDSKAHEFVVHQPEAVAPHAPTTHQPLPHAQPETQPASPAHQTAAPAQHSSPSQGNTTPSVSFHAPQPSQRNNDDSE